MEKRLETRIATGFGLGAPRPARPYGAAPAAGYVCGLVLGPPGMLLLRNVPVSFARRIVRCLATPPVRLLIHPVTAALLDIGGMYVLCLTPIYRLSVSDPVVHILLHVHFVISGYLFTWSIAGPDPAPHRPGMFTRLAVLFLATAAHANLGKIMYGYGYPRGTGADLDNRFSLTT